jgi:hypothetical protein
MSDNGQLSPLWSLKSPIEAIRLGSVTHTPQIVMRRQPAGFLLQSSTQIPRTVARPDYQESGRLLVAKRHLPDNVAEIAGASIRYFDGPEIHGQEQGFAIYGS